MEAIALCEQWTPLALLHWAYYILTQRPLCKFGVSHSVDNSAGLRLRPDIDARKDKKDMYTNPKRLSFADTLSGSKRLDRMALERELDEAAAQVHFYN